MEVAKTTCAVCKEVKHTPIRNDTMGGYICLTCVDKELERLQEKALQIESKGSESDGKRRVRCNHCMSVFYEEYINIDALGPDSGETCPVCLKGDALMDL
jgi:hypothetical protein